MESAFISYGSSQVHYVHGGTGKQLVICFHGYAENATSFEFLEKYAGNDFRFAAIDLPFHGKTSWNKKDFTAEDLVNIVNKIAESPDWSGHYSGLTSNLNIIGYSLGGRMALRLYQAMPQNTKRLILLAPDGLKINFWYWLSTQTWLGNKLFWLTMRYPHWFFGFLKLLNMLRLVNASIFKFVNYYIGDKKVRRDLYERWTCLRKIKPDIKSIKSQITNNKTKVKLIYGQHDRIILPVRGQKFRKGIEANCELSVIHSGHQVLHEKHIQEILPALYD